MEWARASGLYYLFIMIDFDKAYDRVEWPFILSMLKALSLGPLLIEAVETSLAEEASTRLSINRFQFEEVVFFRSIQQGWPITPALYVLATKQVLGDFLDHNVGLSWTSSSST